jgi:hypothetical protein
MAGRKVKPEATPIEKESELEIAKPKEIATESTETEPKKFVERESEGAQPKRVSFKVSDKGEIELEGLRDATKKELKAVLQKTLKNPDAMKQLGLTVGDAPLMFSPEFCGNLYDAIGRVEAMIVNRAMGIDGDICGAVFNYTDEEKKLLGLPTAQVLSKYAPETVGKYKEEIQLATILFGLTAAKVSGAKQLMAKRVEEKKNENPTLERKVN